MDPSYEIRTDYGKALTSLREATSRFSTGCYVLWVPIVARLEVERLVRQALALPVEERLHLRFQVRRAGADGLGLMGSHLIVLNPPFGLQAACEEVMPWLVTQLGQDESAGCEIRLQEKKGGPKPPSLNNHQRVSRVDASRPLRGSSRDPSRG
jgi:23S rRNA (adenine2030-N6)-methyltransferase